MALNFIFTIDGDWDEYFYAARAQSERLPRKDTLLALLERELDMARRVGGKCVHFVHTSPLARDFFLQPEFMAVWKRLQDGGGETGVHCHEEELYAAWHYADRERMDGAIGALAGALRGAGLRVRAYRGGFMTFGPVVVKLLEKYSIALDFSCDPGRHMVKNGQEVSDWRGAPSNVYRLDRDDHRKPGSSSVCEIPLGIYIEQQSLFSILRSCARLAGRDGETMVAVLAHTYDFASWKMRLKIRCALFICGLYGRFVSVERALERIKELGL